MDDISSNKTRANRVRAGVHKIRNVHMCYILLVYDGKAGQGGWGMQAVTGMQVTGVMLNRCDSMQERQTQSSLMLDGKYNQRESRSWIHPSEAFFHFSR